MTEFLIWFIASFISTFGFSYLYYKISDSYVKINLKISIVFIIGVLFLSLVKYYDVTYLSAVSYFLFFPIFFFLINYESFAKYLFYLIFVWIYGVILDMFSMLFVLFLQHVLNFNIYSYISRLILSSFVFLLFIISAKSIKFKNLVNNIYKKVQRINYFDFALVAFAIFVFFVGFVIFLSLDNMSLSVLLMAVLFLLSLSFVLLIRVRVHLIENDIFLNLLKENNEFYLKIEDENRIFKHNLTAKLLSVKSVSDKKARKLIDDLIQSYNKNMDFSIQIKDMPYGLNGIIYEKIYPYIGKLHIKIYNKITFDIFKKLKPRRYNVFVEKMIIALDNAIESCMTSIDKVLVINLYSEDNEIIMDIKNTFSADLNLEELGKINYSTKDKKNGRRRGLGLFSALRDNEVKMSIKIINNLFVTRIVAKQNLIDGE